MEQTIVQQEAISSQMRHAIHLWDAIYRNRAPWTEDGVTQSLNLGATIAGKMAKLVTVELKVSLNGGKRAKFLQTQLAPVLTQLRRYTEYACAKGGLVFKPYPLATGIGVDCVQAEHFHPLCFDSRGEVTSAVFTERVTEQKQFFTKLEEHTMETDGCRIRNFVFVSTKSNQLGDPCPLKASPWADVAEEAFIRGISHPLFSYFRIPQANTVDTLSPLGVSVYANATDLIREADKQFSRLLWEYEGGELAIDADRDALRLQNGELSLPKGKERLFRGLDIQGGSGDLYQVFAPALRDESYYSGLSHILRHIECVCGLSSGTLSEPVYVNRTATEIRETKQDLYATVSEIQQALQSALTRLLWAMDIWATLCHLAPKGEYALTLSFDDSIVADTDAARARDLADVAAGILQKHEYRMRWYGEDESTAKSRTEEAMDQWNSKS